MVMKKCYRCKKEKEVKEFYKRSKGGLRGECKKCSKEIYYKYIEKHPEYSKRADLKHRLKYKFRLTLEEYFLLVKKQDFKCAICKKTELENKQQLAIDHNHKNGKIRGLLCTRCNHGIGHFKDDIFLLKQAIVYLSQ